VVDPNAERSRPVVGELAAAGFRPVTHPDTERLRPEHWDLVLVAAPLVRRLETTAPRPWIVAIADADDPDAVASALAGGADDCLVTPHRPGEAALRVRTGLAARAGVPNADARRRDELTGLRDHAGFRAALAAEAAHGARLALALVAVDGLSRLNSQVGFDCADRAIAEIARVLTEVAGPADALGRVAGGTFAWLLPGADGPQALACARSAQRALAGVQVPGWGAVPVSIGTAATESPAGAGAPALYRSAELALAQARRTGNGPHLAEQADLGSTTESDPATRALVMAITTKDPQIDRHSTRVADLSVRIGSALGWRGERLARLRAAALLHDVGKLAIRQDVLSKAGPLDESERTAIRRHPEVGAAIVAEVLSPEQARWVRGHHERWTGGGYPDGLAGEEIPPEARVMAIADAWDAMTEGRAYREALDLDAALAEMRRCAGTQFWPAGVRALADIVAAADVAAGRPAQAEADPPETAATPGWLPSARREPATSTAAGASRARAEAPPGTAPGTRAG
jgi:diguanylate cyclase (GGDEF)-like protein/putative nucleotidyltransferase with HDIG domain